MNIGQRKHVLGVRTGPEVEHPLFETWRAMVRRCTEPTSDPMGLYYHRGIHVYPFWTQRWEGVTSKGWAPGFKQWLNCVEDLCGQRPPGYTLDRIDNDGHYEPRNIRWAPPDTQQRNKRPFIQPSKPGRTGYKYIQFRRGKYEANIRVKGRILWWKSGDDPKELQRLVLIKRLELGLPIPDGDWNLIEPNIKYKR